MNIDKIIKSIENNNLASNYLLCGDQDFFLDKIERSILAHAIPEDQKFFNEKILYGKEIDVFSLISTIKAFPISGDRQLVIVREAHQLKKIDQIETYLQLSSPHTILVLIYKKKIDKRKKWVKLFQSLGVLYESPKVYPKHFYPLIREIVHNKKLSIDKDAEILLIEALGYDLLKINNAINKISNFVKTSIKANDIVKHTGISREYNYFELQDALGARDYKRTLQIIDYFIVNNNKFRIDVIIGTIFSYFSKLLIIHASTQKSNDIIAELIGVHPYFVTSYLNASRNYSFENCINIVSHLKDADIKFKGAEYGIYNHSFLKELIFKIIY